MSEHEVRSMVGGRALRRRQMMLTGCSEITAQVGEARLTFVYLVVIKEI